MLTEIANEGNLKLEVYLVPPPFISKAMGNKGAKEKSLVLFWHLIRHTV